MAFAGLQQQPSNAPAWSVPHVAQPIAVAGSAAPKPQRSPRNANYQIEAALDPVARTITGAETISWRNVATVGAPSLQFHLYYNAWRDNRSSWMRELALAVPNVSEIPQAHRGSIDITTLSITRGGARSDHTSRIRYIAPDDGNIDDRTVMEVPLDVAVAPGETIDVQINWTSRVPRPIRADRCHRQLLLHRSMVPEDRCLRRHRLELPSVPCDDGVLCRLRQLRCEAVRAARLDRRRHRPAARADVRVDHLRPDGARQPACAGCGGDDPPLLPGGRARLRLDDEPGLHRASGTIRAPNAAPCGHAVAAAA